VCGRDFSRQARVGRSRAGSGRSDVQAHLLPLLIRERLDVRPELANAPGPEILTEARIGCDLELLLLKPPP